MALSSCYRPEVWVCKRVWATQARSSLGFSGLDLESVQGIFHMNSRTELLLMVKEKQDPTFKNIFKGAVSFLKEAEVMRVSNGTLK